MSAMMCFSKLGDCTESTSVSHPKPFHGHGRLHNTNFVREFQSERMTTNKDSGRMLIETSLTNRPGTIPTAVLQMNSQKAPPPQQDRMMEEEE